jgi:general secretion pathway protein N
MRRTRLLIAAGVAAFLVFLVAFLPASMLLRFVPAEVSLSGVTGTIWRGAAASIAVKGTPLGRLRWSNRLWRLLLLQAEYRVVLEPQDGAIDMLVTLGRDGRLDISQITGDFPVSAVYGLVAPEGWAGTVELHVERVTILSGFPVSAAGVVQVRNLISSAGPREVNLGSFELLLGEGAVGSDSISGRLRDLGEGPMKVRATIELDRNRRYLMSGEVAAGPDAGPAILRTLSFLGPPDSLGRRPFSIEGTL